MGQFPQRTQSKIISTVDLSEERKSVTTARQFHASIDCRGIPLDKGFV
jgi:hypothetical protein